jgi:hypothetical protein
VWASSSVVLFWAVGGLGDVRNRWVRIGKGAEEGKKRKGRVVQMGY